MADVTVPLSRTYGQEIGRPFTALVFRSPRWQDFIDLGDIEEWQPVEGRAVLIRHPEVVAAYAERCLKEPNSTGDLSLLDLRDVFAVHEAVRGFFTEARTSPASRTNLSSGSEKGSTTSGG